MSVDQYLMEMKKIQNLLLEFIDKETDSEENYQNLQIIFNDTKISDDRNKLKSLLYLIVKISKYHIRSSNFFSRIEQILLFFKEDIKQKYTNYEIFLIFVNSKRLLLFLVEEKIIQFDSKIIKKIISTRKYLRSFYPQYFMPEFKPFINEPWFPKNKKLPDIIDEIEVEDRKTYNIEEEEEEVNEKWIDEIKADLPEDFYKKRKQGETDNNLLVFIRKDMIKEFIVYINKNSISLNSQITFDIYETNNLILNSNIVSLVELACFYGSIQIFKFLQLNGVKIISKRFLDLAIHGSNYEMIQILEEEVKEKEKNCFNDIVKTAIQCHHNEIANYFLTNYLDNKYKCDIALRYYNFDFIQIDLINETSIFNYLCSFNYNIIFFDILNKKNIDFSLYPNKILLNIAVRKENIEIVKLLLSFNDIDVNKYDYETPLYTATKNENVEIVKLLLSNENIDVNTYNLEESNNCTDNKTALHEAVEKGNIEIVKLLLSNENINVNVQIKPEVEEYSFSIKKTPLMIAIELNYIDIVKELLACENINVNIKSPNDGHYSDRVSEPNETALHLAVAKGNTEIVKLLLSNENIDVNMKSDWEYSIYDVYTQYRHIIYISETALHIAVIRQYHDIIKLLISHNNINVNEEREDRTEGREILKTALHLAVENNDIKSLNILLSCKDIDINKYLHYECGSNDFLLSDEGEYPYNKTALHIALENNYSEIAKLLLSNKNIDVNISDGCDTALTIAVEKENIESIKLLLAFNNINVNFQKSNFCHLSSLCIAIQKDNIEIVKLLLSNENIDINLINEMYKDNHIYEYDKRIYAYLKTKETALITAIERENIEIIKLLLAFQNIDINCFQICNTIINSPIKGKKKEEKTPLYLAIEKQNIEIVRLLLECEKINVNILCKVEFEIEKEPEKKQYNQISALHIAYNKGNSDIIDLLLHHSNIDINIKDKNGKKPIDYANDEIIDFAKEFISQKLNDEEKLNNEKKLNNEVKYRVPKLRCSIV